MPMLVEDQLFFSGVQRDGQSFAPCWNRELVGDRHWRVRLAIIECISQLVYAFLMKSLVFSVCNGYRTREAVAKNLKRLAEEFGPDWAMQHVFPQVPKMVNNPRYLYHMTIFSEL